MDPNGPAAKTGLMATHRGASWLVVGSVLSVQTGQAFGKQLFDTIGPGGVVTLRLTCAALILLLVCRPALPRGRGSLPLVLGLGTAIAGMNLIYPALTQLPVGVAVSLQMLGPFAVALAGARHPRDFVWAGLAAVGVFMFYGPDGAPATTGVVLALLSGAAMGAYVVLNQHAGIRTSDGSFLTWAVVWAAVLCAPAGVLTAGGDLLRPEVLLAGVLLAALSAVIPYSLDLAALRRLPQRVVAVLESLEPVAAGLIGVLLLAEFLSPGQWAAIGCVTVASLGAVLSQRPPAPPTAAATATSTSSTP